MAKEFKDWVDEFVENGANPKDVTNWPEEAGGGSYTAGNGITITKENVINADVKTLRVSDITALTNEQCEALNPADVVIENDEDIFIVTSKNASNLNLVLILSNEVNEAFYLKDADSWEYDSMTTSILGKFKIVYLYGTAGDIHHEEDIQKIIDGAFVMIDDKTMLLPVDIVDGPNGRVIHGYCSAVFNNEYKVCAITITSDTQASYTVHTVTVGGGSSTSAQYAYVVADDEDGKSHQLTFLCDDTDIETYDDLAEYLINHGFTDSQISSLGQDTSTLAVSDSIASATGIYASSYISSGTTVYEIFCVKLIISSGEIVTNSSKLYDGGFEIHQLN